MDFSHISSPYLKNVILRMFHPIKSSGCSLFQLYQREILQIVVYCVFFLGGGGSREEEGGKSGGVLFFVFCLSKCFTVCFLPDLKTMEYVSCRNTYIFFALLIFNLTVLFLLAPMFPFQI